MNGVKEVKGKTQGGCLGCQEERVCELRLEAANLFQYGAYFLGFSDRASGWEGTQCIRLAASARAHERFIAGSDVSERRGRIGAILEALGMLECDQAAEIYVNLAARAGAEPSQLKVVLRSCAHQRLYYLVFLLPGEAAPGADWQRAKS